jgi:putative copper resistance protein D
MAVAVMALTGLLNSIFMVGSFRALLTSAYGQLLISKVILFFVMVGFGARNLFLLKPRLPAGSNIRCKILASQRGIRRLAIGP